MKPIDAILQRIRAQGPITFADYMELALYGPGGYYEEPPVGRRTGSDFATSPHVSPVFAELLAQILAGLSDGEMRLVELGAGDGTLGSQLRGSLGEGLDYTGVETSPNAIASMRERGLRTAPLDEAIPPGWSGLVLAHELLDNLPFRRVRVTNGAVEELMVVEAEDGKLGYRARPCPEEVAAAAPPLDEGEEATIPLAARELIRTLATRMSSGVVLIVDYESAGGPWGYRDHARRSDLLEEPGSADITAGINFGSLAAFASSVGFHVEGPVSQREALLDAGFASLDEQLLAEQARAQEEGRAREALRLWSYRREAQLLIDPTGLGGHRWMRLHLGQSRSSA